MIKILEVRQPVWHSIEVNIGESIKSLSFELLDLKQVHWSSHSWPYPLQFWHLPMQLKIGEEYPLYLRRSTSVNTLE